MAALCQRVAGVPGILSAETNALTGSVLVLFDPEKAQSLEFLLAICEALEISPEDIDPGHLEALLQNGLTNELGGSASFGEVGQDINWRLVVPGILATLGCWSVLRSPATGPTWYDYLWFAFGSYFMLNPDARMPKEEPSTCVPDKA